MVDLSPMLANSKSHQSAIDRFVDVYLSSWANEAHNTRDVLFDENATFEDPVGGTKFEGLPAIKDFWQGSIDFGLKINPEHRQTIYCGHEAIVIFDMTVTSPDGNSTCIRVIENVAFNDAGKVTSVKAFWDEGCVL